MKSHRPQSVAVALLAIPLLLAGGATSSSSSGTVKSYTDSFNKARPGFGRADMAIVDGIFSQDGAKRNGQGMLANWEMGAAHQAVGQWKESIEHFLTADSIARELEAKAVVSGNDVAKTAGSLMTNDNALEFKGDIYEKVMAHSLNALNFLGIGDLQGARVEIRKADEYQKLALANEAKELMKAQAKDETLDEKKNEAAERRKTDEAVIQQKELKAEFEKMGTFTANVKNSFQNPFTYFLSGLVYEMNGEKDDALIDYKKALELAPDSTSVQASVLRLARLQSSSDATQLASKFGPTVVAAATEPSSDQGEVIVLYEEGFVPQKQQVKFPLPMPNGSLGFTAFPVYTDFTPSPERLEIASPNGAVLTEPVVDLHVLAVKALQDRWFGIAGREVARIVAKELAQAAAEKVATKAAGSYGKLFASIGGAIFKEVTQNADLRSFCGLPQQMQVVRFTLPAGDYDLPVQRIHTTAQTVNGRLHVTVRPGKKTIVTVRNLPNLLTNVAFGG